MKKILLTALLSATATGAFGHTGHIGEVSGHDHLVVLASALIGLSIGLVTLLRHRNTSAKTEI